MALEDRLVHDFQKHPVGVSPAEMAGKDRPEAHECVGVGRVGLDPPVPRRGMGIDDDTEVLGEQQVEGPVELRQHRLAQAVGLARPEQPVEMDDETDRGEAQPTDRRDFGGGEPGAGSGGRGVASRTGPEREVRRAG